jgi:hypothetical protein
MMKVDRHPALEPFTARKIRVAARFEAGETLVVVLVAIMDVSEWRIGWVDESIRKHVQCVSSSEWCGW